MKLDQEAIRAMEELIPSHMHGGLTRYYENGIEPGSFLTAVINNDLKEAVARADSTNKLALHGYVMWFYNYAPSGSWGYDGAAKDWLTKFHEVTPNLQQQVIK